MTTWLCCDNCGIMSFAECAEGWLMLVEDMHYCAKCRVKDALRRAAREPNYFAGLPERLQPRGGTPNGGRG